jgi:hypothetical protein
VVERIRPERTDILAYLAARELWPQAMVTLKSKEELDGTLVLALGNKTVVVGESVAAHVLVRPTPESEAAL